jgi:cell division septal protein FtsQ
MRRQQKPRARNRRVSSFRQRRQQHLLDVKVRSRSAIQHRNRKVLVLFSKIALVIALSAAIYVGGRIAAKRFFLDNPDYKLSSIEVQTDGTLQREQILSVADLREGENIFRVNLARVHERLQDLPQVDEVEVVRKLPAEIDIRIVERKPIAWITTEKQIADPFASDAAFLVDARGVLMKEKKLLPEYLGLPLILGASESLEAGKTVASPEAKAALELLRLSTRSFMQTRFQVREIDISKGYCLVVTDKNHSKVTFGFDNLDLELQRLEQFLVYSDDAHREIATVNLLVQRNIPVTFQKSSTEVINDTIQPEESPRVMKAIPMNAPAKPMSATPTPKPKKPTATPRPTARPRPTPTATPSVTPTHSTSSGQAKRGLFQPFFKKN